MRRRQRIRRLLREGRKLILTCGYRQPKTCWVLHKQLSGLVLASFRRYLFIALPRKLGSNIVPLCFFAFFQQVFECQSVFRVPNNGAAALLANQHLIPIPRSQRVSAVGSVGNVAPGLAFFFKTQNGLVLFCTVLALFFGPLRGVGLHGGWVDGSSLGQGRDWDVERQGWTDCWMMRRSTERRHDGRNGHVSKKHKVRVVDGRKAGSHWS